jgi:uncharacterized protein (TIGR03435 family)
MRDAAVVGEGREVGVLRRTERAAGLRRPIELRESTAAMEPGVFGIVRPVLAWPAGISERLDDVHLEAVMAHEVCHVRRRDNLTATLHMFVEAVFWFNPMVWWVGTRLVEERERACDEEVLAHCGQPQAYAESILKVCEFCVQTPMECVSGVTGADLKKRVVEIMTERVVRKLTLGKKLLLVAVATLVAAVPLMLGQAQAASRLEAMIPMILAPRPVQALLATAGLQTNAKTSEPKAEVQDAATADAATAPAFEVATVRPGGPDPIMVRMQMTPGRLTVNAMTLKGLIEYAYGIRQGYVFGGPNWVGSELFDVNAKAEDKEAVALAALPLKEQTRQYRAMMGGLLAERFKLRVRQETKDSAIYELVVAKGGPKLTSSPALVADQEGYVPPEGASSTIMFDGRHIMKRTSIQVFATQLGRDPEVAREVVDATGLKGLYDFEYKWKAAQNGSGPSLFAALEEQLGLKLVAARGPVETLAIEHVEKPSVDGAETPVNDTPGNAAENTRASFVLVAQDAGAPPPPPVMHFPQAVLSSRGKKGDGPGIIDLPQAGFAAEITLAIHGTTDWLQSVQVISRSLQNIVSVRIGWAYVLPNGTLEFHQGDDQKVQGSAATNTNFQLGSQNAAVRPDVKDFIAFVEQVTLKDGTVVNADHDKIAATYKDISEGKSVALSKTVVDPNSTAAQRAGTGPQLTPGLKPISFDVVSFRRAERPGPTRVDLPADGDFIAYHGVPILRLILFAHIARKGYVSVSGEPDWAKNDLYDFQAKVAPEDVAEWRQMSLTDKRAMVATLLADVLKLKVHQDTEPHPVYDLIVAKGGPKLTEYQPGDTVKAPGGRVLTGKVLAWFDPFTLVCQDTTMAELVNSLSGPERAGRIVIDKTELSGAYNFTVPIPYGPLPQQIMDMSDAPSVYEGLKALGLQMVPSKGIVDDIVVDHVERPPEN